MRTRQPQRTTRPAVVYACERCLRINASADTVWRWMADVRRLLRLNIFHAAVEYPEPALLKDCVLHYIGTVENADQVQGPGWDV